MGYRAKDTRRSAAKAGAKRRIVEDKVDASIGALARFDDRMKDIAKTNEIGAQATELGLMYNYFQKQSKLDKADYESYKSTFDELLLERKGENPDIDSYFPSYKDYKKGDFNPTIGDTLYNRTALGYKQAGVGSDILDVILKANK